ncbi:MAG: UbiD family decarboxylase [Desulfuromonadaceae bacterium]|nr:UbiD family decarboxylase [Desulfuromonadaceae bacterium]
MPTNNLSEFIATLESDGELSRISVETDPLLEIAAITDRICKQPDGGKALLFERPTGSNFRVATNLFGSERRVCLALGIDHPGRLTERLSAILGRIPDVEFGLLDRRISALPEFSCFRPNASIEPDPDLTTMDPPDLAGFPFLQSWPEDGSASGHPRYITLPQVFSIDPDGGTPNSGLYRIQVRGSQELGIQWKEGSGAARHAWEYHRNGKAMPVAVLLGGDPASLFSAMFPLPGALDEMTFAGFLRGAPLATLPCKSVPMRVPYGAEVVIEGYVHPGESVVEGPFGNHTGYYSPAAPAALMRVTAIRHRPDAIMPATVVGPPPMEDCWMAKAWERLLLAFIRKLVPSINDIHFPFEWIFHQSAIISLENPGPGMVSEVSGQLWALPWFKSARVLLFVSADSEVNGLSGAAWKGINVTDFTRDIYHDRGRERVALDATGCRLDRQLVKFSVDSAALVANRWKEYNLP